MTLCRAIWGIVVFDCLTVSYVVCLRSMKSCWRPRDRMLMVLYAYTAGNPRCISVRPVATVLARQKLLAIQPVQFHFGSFPYSSFRFAGFLILIYEVLMLVHVTRWCYMKF